MLAWEIYIKNEIASGWYGTASDVARESLRAMEERKPKLEAAGSQLVQGAAKATAYNFIDNFFMDSLIGDLGNEA